MPSLETPHLVSLAKAQDEMHAGQSFSKTVGFLPIVESKLEEAILSAPSSSREASESRVPFNLAGSAHRQGRETGFYPSTEDCENIKTDSPYGMVHVVEETRMALEQVGAQNKVL
jgi:hypothetical protein